MDYRETDFYAPSPIAWSTFLGRPDDSFRAEFREDGTVDPNALDQILLQRLKAVASLREACVYDDEGNLLNYYDDPARYVEFLKKRFTVSDHLMNVVLFESCSQKSL